MTHRKAIPFGVTAGFSLAIAASVSVAQSASTAGVALERFNVSFASRSFDLSALATAIRSLRPASEVHTIVADYEARARADRAAFAARLAALGGRVRHYFWIVNAVTIEVSPDLVPTLVGFPGVTSVAPDLLGHPAGAEAPTPVVAVSGSTNANHHNADYVQQVLGIKGTGFSVAHVNTGLDENMAGFGRPHRVFYRNQNPNDRTGGGIGGSLLLANHTFTLLPADDQHGWGTATAGLVNGNGWGTSTADVGHAYDAFSVGYGVCEFATSCLAGESVIVAALQQVAADRVRFNMPVIAFGYTSVPSPVSLVAQATDTCALVADQIVLGAVGRGAGAYQPHLNGVSAGAIALNTRLVDTSSFVGPHPSDPRLFVPDIIAVNSPVRAPLLNAENQDWTSSGHAPGQVAGAALLVKAGRPTANALEIKAVLLAHTEDILSQQVPPRDNRNVVGMGYLRDDLAVERSMAPGSVLSGSLLSVGTPDTYSIAVTQNANVDIALTWFRHVVTATNYSDLRLRVLNGTTVIAANDDPRNTYEVVRFTAPITGTLVVEVSANSLEVTPLPYGLAMRAAVVGTAAHYAFFGSGCSGTGGIPTLVVARNPVLGQSWTLGLAHARTNALAFAWLGVSDTSYAGFTLPLSLAPLAPGCSLLASPDVLVPLATDGFGTASLPLVIPADGSLLGSVIYNQAMVVDPVNPLGVVLTQGGRMTLGAF